MPMWGTVAVLNSIVRKVNGSEVMHNGVEAVNFYQTTVGSPDLKREQQPFYENTFYLGGSTTF